MALTKIQSSNLANNLISDSTIDLQNDVATLALHSAIQNNQSAYNLSNAFIDHYEDDSGIDTTSTVSRDVTNEFMASGTEQAGGAAFVNDANTMLLLHMDGADGGTTFTDSSSNGLTTTSTGNAFTETSEKKIGTSSLQTTASSPSPRISTAYSSVLASTGDFTVEMWLNSTYTTGSALLDMRNGTDNFFMDHYAGGTNNKVAWEFGNDAASRRIFTVTNQTAGVWNHMAVVRDTSHQWYFYWNGVSISPDSGDMTSFLTMQINDGKPLLIGTNYSFGDPCYGYYDEFRLSNNVRYPNGTTFMPNPGVVTSASGNYTSTTQTSASTVSKMSLVLLYKDAEGTATLDTDLVAQVSADGGSNYVSAPLTAGGTFSSGINIAKSNDITITNTGTAPKYKVSFANQSAGSKVTQVYGAALLY